MGVLGGKLGALGGKLGALGGEMGMLIVYARVQRGHVELLRGRVRVQGGLVSPSMVRGGLLPGLPHLPPRPPPQVVLVDHPLQGEEHLPLVLLEGVQAGLQPPDLLLGLVQGGRLLSRLRLPLHPHLLHLLLLPLLLLPPLLLLEHRGE